MKLKQTLSLSFVLLLSAQAAQAAIALDRTRAIFEGTQKSISLNIRNDNTQLPYLAQSWLEDINGKKISDPLVVVPLFSASNRVQEARFVLTRRAVLPNYLRIERPRFTSMCAKFHRVAANKT